MSDTTNDNRAGQAHSGQDRPSRKRSRATTFFAVVAAVLLCGVAAAIGFVAFVSQLHGAETSPQVNADGIVVLTGGSSRVSDAMELLAGGFGQRLLISGVHRTNGATDISRSVPDSEKLLACCVDLDHSAINTRSNAVEAGHWAHERGFRSLIIVTSNYHMPRAIVEMSHVMPDVKLVPYAVVGETWRAEPWWSSGPTMRLLLSEYAKYVFAKARIRLARLVPAVDDVAAKVDLRLATSSN